MSLCYCSCICVCGLYVVNGGRGVHDFCCGFHLCVLHLFVVTIVYLLAEKTFVTNVLY